MMTKSDKLKEQISLLPNNMNKLDLKLKNLDNYNNERLLTAVNSSSLLINTSDFIAKNSSTDKVSKISNKKLSPNYNDSIKYG